MFVREKTVVHLDGVCIKCVLGARRQRSMSFDASIEQKQVLRIQIDFHEENGLQVECAYDRNPNIPEFPSQKSTLTSHRPNFLLNFQFDDF